MFKNVSVLTLILLLVSGIAFAGEVPTAPVAVPPGKVGAALKAATDEATAQAEARRLAERQRDAFAGVAKTQGDENAKLKAELGKEGYLNNATKLVVLFRDTARGFVGYKDCWGVFYTRADHDEVEGWINRHDCKLSFPDRSGVLRTWTDVDNKGIPATFTSWIYKTGSQYLKLRMEAVRVDDKEYPPQHRPVPAKG